MDTNEARTLLLSHLDTYLTRGYGDLAKLIDSRERFSITGPSGQVYQVQLEIYWDDKSHGDIRVSGHIDDRRLLRAIFPLSESLLIEAPHE